MKIKGINIMTGYPKVDTRRRVRLSIPKLVKEVLEEDMEYFNIRMENLCNTVVKEMGYNSCLRFHENLEGERKVMLNFNLNPRNTKYLQDMVVRSGEETDAGFLRSLLSTYANLHPYLREKVLYRIKFKELEIAIKSKALVRIEVQDNIHEGIPQGFERDRVTKYGQLKIMICKECHIYHLKDIEILKIEGR